MVNQKPDLFRKESVERLSSPERLDQLMQVVDPKAWLPLASLGALAGVAVIWSIVGSIPITVTGQGVLIRPHKVVQFQSPGSGQLLALNVHVGDTVRKGDVLGTIDQADMRKQLQQERAKLAELQAQNQRASSLQGQRNELDKKASQQQRQTLQQSLQATQTVTPILKEKGIEALQRDRLNLEQRLQEIRGLLPTLKKRLNNRQRLFQEGAVPDDTVLQSRQEYLDGLAKIDDAESQLKQLDVKEADAQRQYLENINSITDLKAKLRQLDSQEASLAQQNLETSTNRQNQLQEVKRNIGRLELQLQTNGKIVSDYDGRILEIAAVPGQVLSPGFRIGSINAENPSDKLVSVTYFTIADGKQIKSGEQVQVTPNTVKRERFGGILGTVTTVSPFPATPAGATALVGSEEIVKNLMSGDRQVEVFAQLQEDPSTESGFKWSSSKGPPQKISPGTTTVVSVKVGEKRPISYVIPILKSITGIY
jgi:HlyD family secretion protein